MNRLFVFLPLLVLAGCPDSSTSAPPKTNPAQERAAQVDLDTRLAEGGEAVQAEATPDAKVDAPTKLPELRYYAFDG